VRTRSDPDPLLDWIAGTISGVSSAGVCKVATNWRTRLVLSLLPVVTLIVVGGHISAMDDPPGKRSGFKLTHCLRPSPGTKKGGPEAALSQLLALRTIRPWR
jgi:hypothetical protein